MSLTTRISEDGKRVTITISGRFDFNLHQEFRQAYDRVAGNDVSYTIDLAGADYMDSSALGMLLLLRERAGGDAAKIHVINCSSEIRKILAIANFDQLFKIN